MTLLAVSPEPNFHMEAGVDMVSIETILLIAVPMFVEYAPLMKDNRQQPQGVCWSLVTISFIKYAAESTRRSPQ